MKITPKASEKAALRRTEKVGKKNILLVDDHPLMRAGIKQLINQEPTLNVYAEAGSPAEAFTQLTKKVPDLLLTDLCMPGRAGTEFIEDVLAVYPDLLILVHSMHDEKLYAESVVNVGAQGYLMKGEAGEYLLKALHEVFSGNVYLSEEVKRIILNGLKNPRPTNSKSPVKPLSNREFQIYEQIGEGLKPRETAAKYGLSIRTVDAHRCNIRAKLNLPDFAALTRHATLWVESNGKGPKS